MIRVMIDSGNTTDRTGTGIHVATLLAGLRTYAADRVETLESGISLPSRHARPVRRLGYLWRLRQLAAAGYHGADVVHFINVFVPARHRRAKYAVTIHDLDPLLYPGTYTRRYVFYFGHAIGLALKRADRIVTMTEAVRESILERHSIPPERIVACGTGVSPAFARAADEEPAPPAPETPFVLFVGTLTRKKNVAWAVRTVAEGVRRGALPRLRLVLAGNPGFGFGEIQEALREAGDTVVWVRNPDLPALIRLYKSSSAVILPSRCEGYGLPLVEGMYCDKPVVASRISTSLEVAADAAEYFALDNAEELYEAVRTAIRTADDPQRRAARRARLDHYSWKRLAGGYATMYEGAFRA